MKRVLFTLVACLVGISSLMAQSFSLPGVFVWKMSGL